MAYTEDDMKGLSDEEREAIQDEPEEPITEEAAKEITEEAPVTEEVAPAPVEEAKAEEPAKPVWEPVEKSPMPIFVPHFEANLPEGINIKEELKTLDSKFEEGEITLAQYNSARDDLKQMEIKAQIINDINTQAPAQAWESEQKFFFRQEENKVFSNNPVLYGALNQTLQLMSNHPKYSDYSGYEALCEAKKLVLSEFNQILDGMRPETKEQPAPVAPKQQAPPPPSKREVAQIPVTLGGKPAAAENETKATDDLAFIDDLTGEDLERAIAKLSPDQRRRLEKV